MKTLRVWLLLTLALPVFAQTPPAPAPTAPTPPPPTPPAATTPASSPAPDASESADVAIGKLRDGLMDSFKKGDVDTLVTFLDPNVVVTWQNSEVCRGPGGVSAFYERMMSGPKPKVRSIKSDPQVQGRQVYGNWAVSWGNLNDHFILNDGSDLPLNSVFTATIAKRGDRWLVTAFHASVDAFKNPILDATMQKTGLWAGLGGAGVGLAIGWLWGRTSGKKKAKR